MSQTLQKSLEQNQQMAHSMAMMMQQVIRTKFRIGERVLFLKGFEHTSFTNPVAETRHSVWIESTDNHSTQCNTVYDPYTKGQTHLDPSPRLSRRRGKVLGNMSNLINSPLSDSSTPHWSSSHQRIGQQERTVRRSTYHYSYPTD